MNKKYNNAIRCFAFSLLIIIASGCKKEAEQAKQKRAELKNRFEGTYSLLSANSNLAVDLNFDGVSSINMLQELVNIKNSYLELRFVDGIGGDLFDQFWQNQQFPYNGTPQVYDPQIIPMYANQAHAARFTFNDELTALTLKQPDNYDADKFPLPTSVTVMSGDVISVVTSRKVYTTAGWKVITIEARYNRFYTPN